MGLFEKSRNITDTDLRILVQESDDPGEALRRYILSLEESYRQLEGSRGAMDRQVQWLEAGAGRKLNLAEEWRHRAEASAKQGREDLATHARERQQELMLLMGEDRRQLEAMIPQLAETDQRIEEMREKIRKARALRESLLDGADSGGTPKA